MSKDKVINPILLGKTFISKVIRGGTHLDYTFKSNKRLFGIFICHSRGLRICLKRK